MEVYNHCLLLYEISISQLFYPGSNYIYTLTLCKNDFLNIDTRMDPFIVSRLSILILALDRHVKSPGVDVTVIEPLVHQIGLYIMSLAGELVNRCNGTDSLMLLAVVADIEQHPVLSLLLQHKL